MISASLAVLLVLIGFLGGVFVGAGIIVLIDAWVDDTYGRR